MAVNLWHRYCVTIFYILLFRSQQLFANHGSRTNPNTLYLNIQFMGKYRIQQYVPAACTLASSTCQQPALFPATCASTLHSCQQYEPAACTLASSMCQKPALLPAVCATSLHCCQLYVSAACTIVSCMCQQPALLPAVQASNMYYC